MEWNEISRRGVGGARRPVALDDGSRASRAIDAVSAHQSSLSSSLLAHFLVVRIAKETLEALDATTAAGSTAAAEARRGGALGGETLALGGGERVGAFALTGVNVAAEDDVRGGVLALNVFHALVDGARRGETLLFLLVLT